ncbi:DUF1217 domain-containing protein [Sulfitobacter donghicola]|uniref:Flagellar protein n=1 Tax=Sulfitobacter donghicola DSW-25 = KCTC 12864 = JCM 14565 TaxID=1300350 RepID=A0A073IJU2_9RHOB|nr:DUF1217 domain-containing protein [Sulfitobacter donghicola]KEJ90558.1 flagellar protein [Sulfitobacter donghicola DSW-25 = KCTC 12864 = JCM 14565]KIN67803.1 Flagellar protein [Sulfitobacter donghicola DSW-25 = KCTC 12864 = JCM 14565]
MYLPVVPLDGFAGWRFLQETYDSQFAAFSQNAELKRDGDYFRENIGNIETAEELVNDHRLMTVALGAFDLSDDINSKYFIQKILEEGTDNDDSLANRFSDPRYAELSQAFGFGPGEFLKVGEPLFAEAIIDRYEAIEFEIAAGEQNESMRFALYAEREMSVLAAEDTSNDAKWYTLMSEAPLREVFEKALNLPSSFGQIDLDQQLSVFKERAKKEFGTDEISSFTDPEMVQELVTKYVVRNQISDLNAGYSSNAIALTLLSG